MPENKEKDKKEVMALKESCSLMRPAWTSTGGWDAYNHKHLREGIIKNHFIKRAGLL